jgi:hypothetical protein
MDEATTDDKMMVLRQYFSQRAPKRHEEGSYTIQLSDGTSRTLVGVKIGSFLCSILYSWNWTSQLSAPRKAPLLADCAAWLPKRLVDVEALREAKRCVDVVTTEDRVMVLRQYFSQRAPKSRGEATYVITLVDGSKRQVTCNMGSYLNTFLGRTTDEEIEFLSRDFAWLQKRWDKIKARREAKRCMYEATTEDRVMVLMQHFSQKAPRCREEGSFTIRLPDGTSRKLIGLKVGDFLDNILAHWASQPEERKNALSADCSAWLPKRLQARKEKKQAKHT